MDSITTNTIDTSFWCKRVQIYMSTFAKDSRSIQHMLLYGPPGSGKTTSAKWLVDQIWKENQVLMSMSLNAADERSLESIRNKLFPFIRVDWRKPADNKPRFIILDECETLTEAAQLSLQSILMHDPKDICLILICNSQSRIHPKIRQRLLHIRYDPPNRNNRHSLVFQDLTRGDLRSEYSKTMTEERIWMYMNSSETELYSKILQKTNIDYHTILNEILILSNIFEFLDEEIITQLNMIYPCISDRDYFSTIINTKMINLISLFRRKFDTLTATTD